MLVNQTSNYCYIQIIGVHKHRYEILILTEIHYSQLKLLSNFLYPPSSPYFFVAFSRHCKKKYNEILLSLEGHLGWTIEEMENEIEKNRCNDLDHSLRI